MSTLSAGNHTIVLTARDSGGNSGVASIQVSVLPQNAPPTVSLATPASGSSFTAGTSVTLSGTATDPEDGPLTGTALVWTSTRDGVLGTGSPRSTSSLSVGTHQLTLTATDSGGRTGSASVSVTVSAGGLGGLTSATSLAWSAAGRLFLLSGNGLLDVQVASPLAGSTAKRSYLETTTTGQQAVAADSSGAPRIVINHGATLESVEAGPGGFWTRTDLGATDSAVIDAVVDGNGDTRACFFRAGKLMLY